MFFKSPENGPIIMPEKAFRCFSKGAIILGLRKSPHFSLKLFCCHKMSSPQKFFGKKMAKGLDEKDNSSLEDLREKDTCQSLVVYR